MKWRRWASRWPEGISTRLERVSARLERVFTRQERAALSFLIGVGLLGLGVMAWRRAFPPMPPEFIRLEVKVNSATAQELASLPGIGPVLAERIVEHRKRHGRYLTLTDLKRVKGISARTLEGLDGHVRFD